MADETTNPPAAETTTETTSTPESVEIKDATAVYRKNQELLDEVKNLKGLKKFENLNFDEVQEALKTQKSLREKELIKKGDYDKAKAEFEEGFNKKYQSLETRFNQMLKENAYKELQLTLQQNGVRGDDESADELALILTTKEIEAVEKDGKIMWVKKDGVGDTVNLKELIESYRTTKPKFFTATNASGSGANGSEGNGGGNAKVMKRSAFEQMPANEQMAFSTGGGKLED